MKAMKNYYKRKLNEVLSEVKEALELLKMSPDELDMHLERLFYGEGGIKFHYDKENRESYRISIVKSYLEKVIREIEHIYED